MWAPIRTSPPSSTDTASSTTRTAQDRQELFRRMVFTVLVGNRDDHLKNHALLHDAEGGWRLSPAFDIVPQPDMDPMQAIGMGISGTDPSVANGLSQCGDFGLVREAARGIVDAVMQAMRPWRQLFAEWGVDDATIRRLERALSPNLDRQEPRFP